MQVLPAVLRDTFSTSENDLLGKTTCCLEVVGHLASLLYMRGVKQTNVEQLINLIRYWTSNLSALLLDRDNHCIKIQLIEPPLFSIQPKVHFLFHLEDDIRRFAMPVHYETEHGEQYNKFIREAILLTNRHNPSKDVALKLAKQFLVRHLVNGGSFTVTKNDGSASRSRVGSSIMKWQSKIEELLDSRENSDNNDYRTPSTVQDSFVVYKTKCNQELFLGYITKVERKNGEITKYIQWYNYIMYDQRTSYLFSNERNHSLFPPNVLTNLNGNIIMQPVGDEHIWDYTSFTVAARFKAVRYKAIHDIRLQFL